MENVETKLDVAYGTCTMETLANGAPVPLVVITEIASMKESHVKNPRYPLLEMDGPGTNLFGFLIEQASLSPNIYELLDAFGEGVAYDDETVSGEDMASSTASEVRVYTQILGLPLGGILRFHNLRFKEAGLVFMHTGDLDPNAQVELIKRVNTLLIMICGIPFNIDSNCGLDERWLSTSYVKRSVRIELVSRPCGRELQLGVTIMSPPLACHRFVDDYLGIESIKWEPYQTGAAPELAN